MAKAKSKTTNALVPITAGSLPDYGGRFRDQMARQQASTPLTSGMARIRAGQGMFLLPGAQHGVESFDAVALCALRTNRYHEGKYDPNNPTPPVCVAIARLGQHENEMAPDPKWPKVQAESCLVCPRNVRGGRKDCRNGIDVALVSAQGEGIDWEKTAIVSHTISSTGIQPFGKTLAYLGEKGLPLFTVVLRFHSKQLDGQTWYTTVAEPIGALPTGVAEQLAARVEEAERDLLLTAEPFVAVEVAGNADAGPKPPTRRAAPAAGKSKRSLR